ncbi:ribosome biogenesis GTP-binding protein YihA/YsxC [Vallitaleaceae bacterium 9-2]
MNVQNVYLEAVGVKFEQYPTSGLPEIAFAGKSNVGKSSLLNGLINRKKLARTSAQPGKTQTINFYNVEEQLYLVDLPGYGYARVSKADRERWAKVIEDYLHKRETLKQVVLLVDGRHTPSANDQMMMDWIKSFGYEPLVIATKMDKLKRSQHSKAVKTIANTLNIKPGNVLSFSAITKDGKEKIWDVLSQIIQESV